METTKEIVIDTFNRYGGFINSKSSNICTFNKFTKGEQFTKKELINLHPRALDMCKFNEAIKKGDQFTKEEVAKLNPDAWEIVYFNKFTKGEQFTKKDLQKVRYDFQDTLIFNKHIRGECFTKQEMLNL